MEGKGKGDGREALASILDPPLALPTGRVRCFLPLFPVFPTTDWRVYVRAITSTRTGPITAVLPESVLGVVDPPVDHLLRLCAFRTRYRVRVLYLVRYTR